MSLAHLLGVTLETLPVQPPYLSVPNGQAPVVLTSRGLKVGLVWRGNPQHEQDHWRSVFLSLLRPLLDVPDVAFFGLQLGAGREECASAPWQDRVTDLAGQLTDFSATAAAVTALDLVISVDTAVAHLAGALGKPAWLLIPQGNDWRCLYARSDSPWYPSVRLFRQRRQRNWQPAVNAMVRELSSLAAQRGRTA